MQLHEELVLEDYPKEPTFLPRFIPESVKKQIEDNLDALPETIVCMVKILWETGMRISELCNLKFDCIRQDATGAYWIDIYQIKMKKQIPPLIITKNLAHTIYKQQHYIREHLGETYLYLFCESEGSSWFQKYDSPKARMKLLPKELKHFLPIPKQISAETIRGYLFEFAKEKEIRDADGKIFSLSRVHQFRHTHGTELINNGVPQHIVQKRLGHKSPEMTMRYAHIHDQTMKQEMEKFWDGRVVNIKGEVVISENPDLDTAEMQWIKKNMKAQTLPNGFCGLLITQHCPVQGSPCLTCQYFRTTKEHLETHKKHLEDTEKLIENARAKAWQRQVENNLPIAENLKNIIRGLEQKDVIYGWESYPKLGGDTNA
ncbi:integrase [Mastigocladus laminosus UU774]|nr:integrase [Mastigocladus laminosus UU774]